MGQNWRWGFAAGAVWACGILVHGAMSPNLVLAAEGTVKEAGEKAPAAESGAVIGEQAPAFVLRLEDGRTVRNQDLVGKVVVLNLWASWCAPCIDEIPSLERLRKQLAGADVWIVGVSVDRTWEEVRKVVSQTGAHFDMALDPDQNVARAFGTSKFPETYILDKNGKVVRKLIGVQIWDRGDFVASLRTLAE